eukprot:TRINITY_DN2518_c0_g1_i2.p1 TRINITY_DN2518_c0_g1~~TRINITY_DN2518_c0_g1_i2.p1  ORF type:complete len:465 (-),score=129.76 TRINITY_DN2518_c0_g1_i2:483-1877(-)
MLEDLAGALASLPSAAPCINRFGQYPELCFQHLPVPLEEVTHSLQLQAAEYIKELVAAGRLIKQEAVTLAAFHAMSLSTNSSVLDLCAGSGLRSLQVLEHFNNAASSGFVVANTHHSANLGAAHRAFQGHLQTRLMITSHDPANYPLLKHVEDTRVHETYKFDRVLCFAPSSSDGFIGRREKIWSSYNWKTAYKMHKRQIRIISRAVELTKVGGRLVYMVGSMNPLEAEAVIAFTLGNFKGVLEVVDIHKDLASKSHFKPRRGKRRWKVLDMLSKVSWYKRHSEVPEASANYILPSMFSTPYTDLNWKGAKDDPLGLRGCVRIYAHQQESSGLFIAALRKLKSTSDTIYDDFYEHDATENPNVKQYSLKSDVKFMDKWMKELYLPEEEKAKEAESKGPEYKAVREEVWAEVRKVYGVQKEFGSGNLLCKKGKCIVYVEPTLAEYIHLRRSHRLKVCRQFIRVDI